MGLSMADVSVNRGPSRNICCIVKMILETRELLSPARHMFTETVDRTVTPGNVLRRSKLGSEGANSRQPQPSFQLPPLPPLP
jgi:hypothetical protein